MREFEIVERSSGFWVVSAGGATDGPFFEMEDAAEAMALRVDRAKERLIDD